MKLVPEMFKESLMNNWRGTFEVVGATNKALMFTSPAERSTL